MILRYFLITFLLLSIQIGIGQEVGISVERANGEDSYSWWLRIRHITISDLDKQLPVLNALLRESSDPLDKRRILITASKSYKSEVVKLLLFALEDESSFVRDYAFQELSKFGFPMIGKKMLELFRGENPILRSEILRYFIKQKYPGFEGLIVEGMGDGNSLVRGISEKALANIEDIKNTSALIEAIKSSHSTIQFTVLSILSKKQSVVAKKIFLSLIEEENLAVRLAAISNLGVYQIDNNQSEEIIGKLLETLPVGSYHLREKTIDLLSLYESPPLIALMLQGLVHEKTGIQTDIENMLNRKDKQEMLNISLLGANSSIEKIRAGAIKYMARYTTPTVERALLSAAKSESELIRYQAIISLKDHRSLAVKLALFRALKDPHEETRLIAIEYLHHFLDPLTESALIEAVSNSGEIVKHDALLLIGNSNSYESIQVLVSNLEAEETKIRWASMVGLERKFHPSMEKPLIKALERKELDFLETDIRHMAASCLAQFHSPAVDKALIAALGDNSKWVRMSVAIALKDRISPVAEAALADTVHTDEEVEVRIKAIFSLGKQISPAVEKHLLKVLAEERESKVLIAAISSLHKHPSLAVERALILALKNGDNSVRRAATYELAYYPSAVAERALVSNLSNKPEALRGAVAYSLGFLKTQMSMQVLLNLRNDPKMSVRQAVSASIAKRVGSNATANDYFRKTFGRNGFDILKYDNTAHHEHLAFEMRRQSEEILFSKHFSNLRAPRSSKQNRCQALCETLEKFGDETYRSLDFSSGPPASWVHGLTSMTMLLRESGAKLCPSLKLNQHYIYFWLDSLGQTFPEKGHENFYNDSPNNFGHLYSSELFNLWDQQKIELSDEVGEKRNKLNLSIQGLLETYSAHQRSKFGSNLNSFLLNGLSAASAGPPKQLRLNTKAMAQKLNGKCEVPYNYPRKIDFSHGDGFSHRVGAAGKSVVFYYDYWKSLRAGSEKDQAQEWLIDCLKNFSEFSTSHLIDTLRSGIHEGAFGIAPYAYYPALAYVLPLMKFFEDKFPDFRRMRQRMVDINMILYDKEQKLLKTDIDNDYQSKYYSPILFALSLMSSFEGCNKVKNTSPYGLLQGYLGKLDPTQNLTPLNKEKRFSTKR